MSKFYYSLKCSGSSCELELTDFIHVGREDTVLFEIDSTIFPLKTKEEACKYFTTLVQKPESTKILPGFIMNPTM